MRRHNISSIICMLFAVLLLVGCSSASAPEISEPSTETQSAAETGEPQQTYQIKLSISEALDPDISIEAVGALKFKEEVEKKSNNAVTVEIFPGGTLGESDSVIDQMRNNIIQVAAIADAKISGFYAPIQALSIPYLYSSRDHAYAVFDSENSIITEMNDDMAASTGLRIIGFGENGGFRCFSNSKREIHTADDMAGLKIRCMNSPLHMDIVTNLGGVPTPLGISELYTALQTNAVDGQENAPIVTALYHFEEVQKYYTLDKHVYSITAFLINDSFLQSLPEEYKQIVIDAGHAASQSTRDACMERETGVLEQLAENGMQIYEPTEEEFNTFKEATQQPAIDYLKDNIDVKWVDGVLDLADSVK